jgi:hypothetical protein
VPAAPTTASGSALPLGTVTLSSAPVPTCPAGSSCYSVEVACPGANPIVGFLSVAPATAPPIGLVLLHSGGGGTGWYTDLDPEIPALVDRVRAAGIAVMQIHWRASWFRTGEGSDAGIGVLGCRPATIARYVHDTHYVPLGVDPSEPGRCGFCFLGSSGGSSAVSYPISHYGLDSILDAVIPVAGPPHSAMAKGCMRTPGEERYWYEKPTAIGIDESFGYYQTIGPCQAHDASFAPRWIEQGVSSGGSDYTHLATRVHMVMGEKDNLVLFHTGDWMQRLLAEGSPLVYRDIVPGIAHVVHGSPEGRAAIEAAILYVPGPTITFTAGPSGPTNEATHTFSWISNYSFDFTCTLDTAPAAACGSGFGGSVTYANMSEGPHTVTVQGTGTGGPATATRSFTVDTIPPPAPTFTQVPPNPSGPLVSFSFTDPEGGVTFSCTMDAGPAAVCGSPASYSGLSDGGHTFSVRATDPGGNTSGPTTYAWTVSSTLGPYTLAVAKAGAGKGVVKSSPAGIKCGVDCSEAYTTGTIVTLTAKPGPNSAFGGWSGACIGTGPCALTMDADRAVTATFVPA